jgi:ABC-type transport system involved in multi-copper enzyme maturation permease subunit
MKSLLKSEFRKLRTTRTVYGFVLAMVVVAVVTVVDTPKTDFADPLHEQGFVLFTGLLTRVLLVVLGIRIITDEFRHGTIVPSLLATPRRLRVLAAKLVMAGLTGAVLAAVAGVAMVLAALSIGPTDGAGIQLDAEAGRTLAGFIGAGALWTTIGVALGTIVRSQVLAIVGGLLWLMGIEDMLKSRLGDLSDLLPGGAGLIMVVGSSLRQVLIGALILLTFAAALSGASALAITRREVD